jgi:hypothetical protein
MLPVCPRRRLMQRPRFRRFGGIAEGTLIPLAGKHNWEGSVSGALPVAKGIDSSVAVSLPVGSADWSGAETSEEHFCSCSADAAGAENFDSDIEFLEFHDFTPSQRAGFAPGQSPRGTCLCHSGAALFAAEMAIYSSNRRSHLYFTAAATSASSISASADFLAAFATACSLPLLPPLLPQLLARPFVLPLLLQLSPLSLPPILARLHFQHPIPSLPPPWWLANFTPFLHPALLFYGSRPHKMG